MKKKIIKLIINIKYIYYSLKNINSLKLGENVKHNGLLVTTIQGVADPYWDVLYVNEYGERKRINRVHKSELKQSNTVSAMLFRFNSHYKFLKGYWFSIDVDNFKSPFSSISYK
jgi:hypothetical protein